MKKELILLFLILFSTCAFANDSSNGDIGRKRIEANETLQPRPHLIDLAEPVVMYTISTATIDITFDANYYSEYTIHLVGEYVEMDYFVYTPVVYIPVATFGEVIDIYIESDDCGCYYGTLDQSK